MPPSNHAVRHATAALEHRRTSKSSHAMVPGGRTTPPHHEGDDLPHSLHTRGRANPSATGRLCLAAPSSSDGGQEKVGMGCRWVFGPPPPPPPPPPNRHVGARGGQEGVTYSILAHLENKISISTHFITDGRDRILGIFSFLTISHILLNRM
jgi:hypothetical protein